ncbi:4Fe-4S dicluster domain-containing protein [Vibrio sp. SS-MA-C1-2]|uniref:4Fe-4S dicluster domain-containing protein n=1 Tax=Vibrio sp. SS-MA-C1-2 TaxID=2908646 RepID=UPI001F431F17|nr:reductive dehalogenase domain-containing protein [Vibrio sp. SS-MA-C1-2]UJF17286.1 4Fe-4S dicluster domain-containing protein [Vibrio sp. SS-MA-C1-2]
MTVENNKNKLKSHSRRNFLKFGGAAATVGTIGAVCGTGYVQGQDPDANVGYGRTEAGADQFFDREPFRVDVAPTLIREGNLERPEWGDFLFNRHISLSKSIKKGYVPDDFTNIPDPRVKSYYQKHPERWPDMKEAFIKSSERLSNLDQQRNQFAISWAFTAAQKIANAGLTKKHLSTMTAREVFDKPVPSTFPIPPVGHPDLADRALIPIDRDPMPFKSSKHAADLIKEISHKFGASFVGITKVHPEWVFKGMMRGMDSWGDEIPKHWKNMIIVGVPMNWDSTYASVGYSTSAEAYHKLRMISGKMQAFLGQLGYAGRVQVPSTDYETILPPHGIAAGLGEATRNGIMMCPETGANIRIAGIITDLDMELDKPIDLNMKEFCVNCKICADACPSGSISKADQPDVVVRGYRKYNFNQDSCWKFWNTAQSEGGRGCRVCIAVCPYTRKNNWIHAAIKEIDPRDPTHITQHALLAMQHNFFYYPDPQAFHPKWNGGKDATYHLPPEWMRSENYFDIEKTWEYDGNWGGF